MSKKTKHVLSKNRSSGLQLFSYFDQRATQLGFVQFFLFFSCICIYSGTFSLICQYWKVIVKRIQPMSSLAPSPVQKPHYSTRGADFFFFFFLSRGKRLWSWRLELMHNIGGRRRQDILIRWLTSYTVGRWEKKMQNVIRAFICILKIKAEMQILKDYAAKCG